MAKSVFRFFDQVRYAEQLLNGSMRFRSLAYYRDYEEQEVRGDDNEGTSIYKPSLGLELTNHTRGFKSVRAGTALESEANSGEIFIYCMTTRDTAKIREKFKAVACVEILNVPEFCRRVESGLPNARFGGRPGRERVAHAVEYYNPNRPPEARWACPDLIACSKLDDYAWQQEVRLLFSRTDALKFENVRLTIVEGRPLRTPDPSQHHVSEVEVGHLEDIAILSVF